MKRTTTKSIFFAVIAAALFAINTPLSKLLLPLVPSPFLAAYLYLGAGFGMLLLYLYRRKKKSNIIQYEAAVSRDDLPYVIAMILLDVAAPVLLLYGLSSTTASIVSLLINFEIVATAMISFLFFREHISKRMWIAVIFITLACMLLSLRDISAFQFSPASLFVLLACICWGIENNCTKKLSAKDPVQIVMLKGLGSGLGALLLALIISDMQFRFLPIMYAFILGFVSYGLSIYFYIKAQRKLGAAVTSSYYAAAPFLGALLSYLILKEDLGLTFLFGIIIMLAGSYFIISDYHSHDHIHLQQCHDHRHCHNDEHHFHTHSEPVDGEHAHPHSHEELLHNHEHTPDIEHQHKHY